MSTTTERLAILIDANASGALREFDKVGSAAEREMGRAENRVDRVGASMTRNGALMVGAGALMVTGLANASKASMDLNDEVSQSDAIFGEAAASINEFAKGAVAIGQSERAASAAANTFGLFFTNAGKSADEAAGMSIEMAKLASDMASFKNTTPEEAVEALGAALRGESEPIRRYGVMLDDATLKQRALDMGLIESTTGVLPPAIKMQAAYGEILAQTGTIQGDFARTADSGTNAQRRMTAEAENAKAAFGQGFVPIMTKAYEAAGLLGTGVSAADDATGGLASTVAAYGGVGLVAVGATSTLVGKLIEMRAGAATAFESFRSFSSNVGASPAKFAAAGAAVAALAVATYAYQQRLASAAEEGRKSAGDIAGGGTTEQQLARLRAELDAVNASLDSIPKDVDSSGIDNAISMLFGDDTDRASAEARRAEIESLIAGLEGSEAAANDTAAAMGSNGLAQAQQEAATATENHAKAAENVQTKLRELMDPLFGATNAIAENAEAQRRAEEASLAVFLSQVAYNDAVARFGETSPQATEAGTALAEATRQMDAANLAAAQSAMTVDGAVAELSAKMADGSIRFDDARAKLAEWVGQGYLTEAQAQAVATKLGDVAWRAGMIPRDISTNVSANVDQALNALGRLGTVLDSTIYKAGQALSGSFGQGLGFAAPGRASGGPMAPWSVYELHDTASPEVAQIGGRTMLFTGAQGGQVTNLDRTPPRQTAGASSGRPAEVVLQLDGKEIARVVRPHLRVLDNEAR